MQFVMVITRDQQLVKSVEGALDSGWFKIWHFKSTREALTALGQQEPALTVCDGRADIDAHIELVRKMKLDLGQNSMMFLLLTHSDHPPEMNLIRDAGVDDILKWPAPTAVLGAKLRSLIEKHEALSTRALVRDNTIELATRKDSGFGGFELERSSNVNDSAPFTSGTTPPTVIEPPRVFGDTDGVVFEHGFGMADETPRPKISFNAADALPCEIASDSSSQIPQARLEELATRLLDQKLTEAARTQIKKLIVSSVQQEMKRLMPQIVEMVRKEMAKS